MTLEELEERELEFKRLKRQEKLLEDRVRYTYLEIFYSTYLNNTIPSNRELNKLGISKQEFKIMYSNWLDIFNSGNYDTVSQLRTDQIDYILCCRYDKFISFVTL